MKKKQSVWNERGTKPVLIVLAVIILLTFVAYEATFAGDAGWGYSYESAYWNGSYWHSTDCDSGHILFGYSDSTNYYDTIGLVPSVFDSAMLLFTDLYLDSIGEHQITVVYYERGATQPDSVKGSWTHAIASRVVTLTAPSAANTCNVFGFIDDGAGRAVVGAKIEGVRVGSGEGIDTTSTTTIAGTIPTYVYTDTLGLFQLVLRKTNVFADTTRGFYNITATFGGAKLFEVKRFYVPDLDSVNIGDTILGRSN